MANKMIGEMAPDFTLPDQHGRPVRLADYRGKQAVVLVFYVSDLNPDSPGQMSAYQQAQPQFEKVNAQVFGISKSSSELHKDFAQKNKLDMPLLTDRDNAVATSYGLLGGFGPFKSVKRSVVVVDPTGQIVYFKQGDPSPEEVVRALADLNNS